MRRPTRLLVLLDKAGPGDALSVAWTLQDILEAHPRAKLTILAGENVAEAVRMLGLPARVVVCRLLSTSGRAAKAAELARLARLVTGRYDIAITLLWGTTLLNLLGRLAAPVNVGYENRHPGLLTSRLGRHDPSRDAAESQVELLAAAGIHSRGPRPLHLPGDPAAAARAAALLGASGVVGRRLAVLHAGSDWACQQWLPERWAALARSLAGRGLYPVFTGLAKEHRLVADIQARLKVPSTSLVGRTSLAELAEVLRGAELCVTVDSAVHDLSQGVGTRTIVLAGPSQPSRILPGAGGRRILNLMPEAERSVINRCREPKWLAGGCGLTSCAMAGLRRIDVRDVLAEVS